MLTYSPFIITFSSHSNLFNFEHCKWLHFRSVSTMLFILADWIITTWLHWIEPFVRRYNLSVKKSSPFMVSEGALQCSQNPPVYPVLRQLNPIHIITNLLFKINFNNMPPSHQQFQRDFFPLGFGNKMFYTFLIFPVRAICQPILFSKSV